MRRARAAAALLAAAAVLGACGDPRGPQWVRLAALPIEGQPAPGEVVREEGRAAVSLELSDGSPWLVTSIAGADWRPEPPRAGAAPGGSGYWRAALPVLAIGPARAGAAYRLSAGECAFEYQSDAALFEARPGSFSTEILELRLHLGPGEAPPATCELRALACYEPVQGSVHRLHGRRMSGDGFWVPAGAQRSLLLDLEPGSRLSFATVVEAALGSRAARLAEHVFRVKLDGATIFEHRQPGEVLGESSAWHALELPRGGGRRVRLSFECAGPFAYTAFAAPVIGPAAGAAPDPRPDLFFFLADTFRADNLQAYGGEHELAPNLERFAASARLYRHAWSVSTHTLPAHSSMFSGVFPHQNGQVDYANPLPYPVETVAERLTEAGYRCGAVTDAVMVSQRHGLDQGFEWFDERRELPTLERVRAFLDADDGRPMFLFVQSYSVHAPYLPSAAARERLGDGLGVARGFEELLSELEGFSPDRLAEVPPELVAGLRALYRATVHDLDQLFAGFQSELEARGLLAQGTLFFASDHGEAFFEHGLPFHANQVFEEELRVPLIVRGPGFAPGVVLDPVSLIDVAPTLAQLAGLAPRAHWRGRSLLASEPGRALFAFQSRAVAQDSTLAVIEGTKKLIGYEDPEAVRAGRLLGAFDLERDPGEHADLQGRAAWPRERLRARSELLLELLTPLVAPESSHPTAEELRELERFGYAGAGGR